MRSPLIRIGATLAALAMLGLVVVATGIVPMKASSGHLPPVRWLLEFARTRSVSTHSLTTRAPPLDDPALVLRGAGHYETGCRSCHGAPGRRGSAVAREMTPEPPYLPHTVTGWSPEELFYIVKHGVKMTGMPAWPSQERDDEVWAMVAFLLTLPGMGEVRYRELAMGEAVDGAGAGGVIEGAPDDVLRNCVRCHGRDGRGRGVGAFPKIGGQQAEYLAAALSAYVRGDRNSGIMEAAAGGLDGATVEELAHHFANVAPGLEAGSGAARPAADPGSPPPAGGGEEHRPAPRAGSAPPDPERGRRLAHDGGEFPKIPSCVDCHGPGETARNPRFPSLAGQDHDYLLLQLRLFREDRRGGSSYAPIMRTVASMLDERDMRDVAAWYASLPWDGS